MPENQKARSKRIWTTILFMLLLLPPLLSIFNRPVLLRGIPILFAYIFIAWLLQVLFTAWQSRHADHSP